METDSASIFLGIRNHKNVGLYGQPPPYPPWGTLASELHNAMGSV